MRDVTGALHPSIQPLDWVKRQNEWHLVLSKKTLTDHTFVYGNVYCGGKFTDADKFQQATTTGPNYVEQLPPSTRHIGPLSITQITKVCKTCAEGAKRATGTLR